jgi:hypothetical protein
MSISEIATLLVSLVSMSVAIAAYVTARHDPRPRIQGSINAVLHAPLELPDGRQSERAHATGPVHRTVTALTLRGLGLAPRQLEDHVPAVGAEARRQVRPGRSSRGRSSREPVSPQRQRVAKPLRPVGRLAARKKILSFSTSRSNRSR